MLSEQTKHARAARSTVSPQQQWVLRRLSLRLKEPVEDILDCAVCLYRDVACKGLAVVQLSDVCSTRQSVPVYLIVESLSSTRSQRPTRQLTFVRDVFRLVFCREACYFDRSFDES
jgi:hypothetical protein